MDNYRHLYDSVITEVCKNDEAWKLAIKQIADKTNQKQEHIFFGVAGVVGLYLIVGYFAELLCNAAAFAYPAYASTGVVGQYLIVGYFAELPCNAAAFAYPAYASMVALTTVSKSDDTHWLTYWTVFGLFSLSDAFSETVMSFFPFYWLIKAAFFLYLWHPMTRGAERFWHGRINPLCDRIRIEEIRL